MIYIIQGKAETPVKIGYTKDDVFLAGRLAALQVAHPYPLRAILTVPGSMQEERKIHREMQEDRLLGEWFEWSLRTRAFITTLKACGTIDLAIAAYSTMKSAQADTASMLAETRVAAIFGYPEHLLRAARKAGNGPPFTERRMGKRLLRMYRIGDFRAWLTVNGMVRQSIDWEAARGNFSGTAATRPPKRNLHDADM